MVRKFYFVEIGREWVREMAELTRKYQTKLEDVQTRNKELRLELAEMQVRLQNKVKVLVSTNSIANLSG